MHLLAATPGAVSDGTEAIDLAQTPGDIVFLSAADTELAALSHARGGIDDAGFPSLRLANLLHLGHNMSVDLYLEQAISGARLVIVRLLGGRGYWPYGVEQLSELARSKNIKLALLPGDDQPDAELSDYSTLAPDAWHRLWQYTVHGGPDNARQFLGFAASLIGFESDWQEPKPLLKAGIYGADSMAALKARWTDGQPLAALVFYRALMQAGNLRAVDGLIAALEAAGMNPLPLYVSSLKDPVAAATLQSVFAEAAPDVVLNATGFAVSTPGVENAPTPLTAVGAPVLQVVFSGSDMDSWRDGAHGLSARDIAMNVALPEIDGNVLTRAVSFKGLDRRDDICEADIVTYEPVPDRIDFVVRLAAAWARLGKKPVSDRKVALILANYPNRDGRIGNGVGLDTPAGALTAIRAMQDAGYVTGDLPVDGDALIQRLADGPTNDTNNIKNQLAVESLSLEDYRVFFAELPEVTRRRIIKRWGSPEADPFMRCDGRFAIAAYRLGNVAVCLQAARGYNIDPTASYHDPALVPTHGYLAFYAWVRREFGADAVIHFGKHGNLEWLPGKSLALSDECYPEAALGPTPNLYPFIVNDPGEGTQAKRRTSAVIIDHLTPPLTRAESYG
ncbi:MAG: cobaltochelatase subunit CobN, partial [Alphaproteobacteria bacterium]